MPAPVTRKSTSKGKNPTRAATTNSAGTTTPNQGGLVGTNNRNASSDEEGHHDSRSASSSPLRPADAAASTQQPQPPQPQPTIRRRHYAPDKSPLTTSMLTHPSAGHQRSTRKRTAVVFTLTLLVTIALVWALVFVALEVTRLRISSTSHGDINRSSDSHLRPFTTAPSGHNSGRRTADGDQNDEDDTRYYSSAASSKVDTRATRSKVSTSSANNATLSRIVSSSFTSFLPSFIASFLNLNHSFDASFVHRPIARSASANGTTAAGHNTAGTGTPRRKSAIDKHQEGEAASSSSSISSSSSLAVNLASASRAVAASEDTAVAHVLTQLALHQITSTPATKNSPNDNRGESVSTSTDLVAFGTDEDSAAFGVGGTFHVIHPFGSSAAGTSFSGQDEVASSAGGCGAPTGSSDSRRKGHHQPSSSSAIEQCYYFYYSYYFNTLLQRHREMTQHQAQQATDLIAAFRALLRNGVRFLPTTSTAARVSVEDHHGSLLVAATHMERIAAVVRQLLPPPLPAAGFVLEGSPSSPSSSVVGDGSTYRDKAKATATSSGQLEVDHHYSHAPMQPHGLLLPSKRNVEMDPLRSSCGATAPASSPSASSSSSGGRIHCNEKIVAAVVHHIVDVYLTQNVLHIPLSTPSPPRPDDADDEDNFNEDFVSEGVVDDEKGLLVTRAGHHHYHHLTDSRLLLDNKRVMLKRQIDRAMIALLSHHDPTLEEDESAGGTSDLDNTDTSSTKEGDDGEPTTIPWEDEDRGDDDETCSFSEFERYRRNATTVQQLQRNLDYLVVALRSDLTRTAAQRSEIKQKAEPVGDQARLLNHRPQKRISSPKEEEDVILQKQKRFSSLKTLSKRQPSMIAHRRILAKLGKLNEMDAIVKSRRNQREENKETSHSVFKGDSNALKSTSPPHGTLEKSLTTHPNVEAGVRETFSRSPVFMDMEAHHHDDQAGFSRAPSFTMHADSTSAEGNFDHARRAGDFRGLSDDVPLVDPRHLLRHGENHPLGGDHVRPPVDLFDSDDYFATHRELTDRYQQQQQQQEQQRAYEYNPADPYNIYGGGHQATIEAEHPYYDDAPLSVGGHGYADADVAVRATTTAAGGGGGSVVGNPPSESGEGTRGSHTASSQQADAGNTIGGVGSEPQTPQTPASFPAAALSPFDHPPASKTHTPSPLTPPTVAATTPQEDQQQQQQHQHHQHLPSSRHHTSNIAESRRNHDNVIRNTGGRSRSHSRSRSVSPAASVRSDDVAIASPPPSSPLLSTSRASPLSPRPPQMLRQRRNSHKQWTSPVGTTTGKQQQLRHAKKEVGGGGGGATPSGGGVFIGSPASATSPFLASREASVTSLAVEDGGGRSARVVDIERSTVPPTAHNHPPFSSIPLPPSSYDPHGQQQQQQQPFPLYEPQQQPGPHDDYASYGGAGAGDHQNAGGQTQQYSQHFQDYYHPHYTSTSTAPSGSYFYGYQQQGEHTQQQQQRYEYEQPFQPQNPYHQHHEQQQHEQYQQPFPAPPQPLAPLAELSIKRIQVDDEEDESAASDLQHRENEKKNDQNDANSKGKKKERVNKKEKNLSSVPCPTASSTKIQLSFRRGGIRNSKTDLIAQFFPSNTLTELIQQPFHQESHQQQQQLQLPLFSGGFGTMSNMNSTGSGGGVVKLFVGQAPKQRTVEALAELFATVIPDATILRIQPHTKKTTATQPSHSTSQHLHHQQQQQQQPYTAASGSSGNGCAWVYAADAYSAARVLSLHKHIVFDGLGANNAERGVAAVVEGFGDGDGGEGDDQEGRIDAGAANKRLTDNSQKNKKVNPSKHTRKETAAAEQEGEEVESRLTHTINNTGAAPTDIVLGFWLLAAPALSKLFIPPHANTTTTTTYYTATSDAIAAMKTTTKKDGEALSNFLTALEGEGTNHHSTSTEEQGQQRPEIITFKTDADRLAFQQATHTRWAPLHHQHPFKKQLYKQTIPPPTAATTPAPSPLFQHQSSHHQQQQRRPREILCREALTVELPKGATLPTSQQQEQQHGGGASSMPMAAVMAPPAFVVVERMVVGTGTQQQKGVPLNDRALHWEGQDASSASRVAPSRTHTAQNAVQTTNTSAANTTIPPPSTSRPSRYRYNPYLPARYSTATATATTVSTSM